MYGQVESSAGADVVDVARTPTAERKNYIMLRRQNLESASSKRSHKQKQKAPSKKQKAKSKKHEGP